MPTVGLNKVTRSEIHKSAIACLKEMGKVAADYGMRVSVEFIGQSATLLSDLAKADGKKIFIVPKTDFGRARVASTWTKYRIGKEHVDAVIRKNFS